MRFLIYCTKIMILLMMLCIAFSSTVLSLIIFNFPFVFKISRYLLEFIIRTCRHKDKRDHICMCECYTHHDH